MVAAHLVEGIRDVRVVARRLCAHIEGITHAAALSGAAALLCRVVHASLAADVHAA